MDIPIWLLLILLVLCLFLSACFSGSETAMIALDRYRLRHLAEKGHRGAILAEFFLQKPDQLLSLILLGNNFVNILSSILMTFIALQIGGELGLAIGTGLLTFVILIFSELAPKTFATQYPEKVAFIAVYPLAFLQKFFSPITRLINLLANTLLKLLGVSKDNSNLTMNREELRTLLGDNNSNLDQELSRMIANLLDFEESRIDQIMVQKNEIVGINMNDDEQTILSLLQNSSYNRLPVYNDNLNELVGILHVRDLLSSLASFSKKDILELTIPAYFVPENVHLDAQLENFRKQQKSMAIIVDEYGEITGLLTMGDILEELVGRYTSNTKQQSSQFEQHADGLLILSGSYSLKDLQKDHDIQLTSTNATSINGLLVEVLGAVPNGPCCTEFSGYRFEIVQLNNEAIIKTFLRTTVSHES